jgi:hypothetical protein
MTKKEIKKLDDLIQYLCEHQDRIKAIRQTLDINPGFSFYREVQTIEHLYTNVLEERKNGKSNFFYITSSGWTVMYLRDKNKYEKDEKFQVKIYFSFVDIDTLE